MSDERTQSPTPRRRRQAREQGQVARSHELVAALGFVAAIGAISLCGPSLLRGMIGLVKEQLESASLTQRDTAQSAEAMQQVGFQMILQLLPLLGLLCGVVLVTHLAQTGFLWLPHKVRPELQNLNPMRGLQRLANPSQLGRLLFQTAKVVLIFVVVGAVMWNRLSEVIYLGASDTATLLSDALRLMSQIALALGVALIFFGALDYAFQRWKHEQQLRMTPDQLREEVKAIRGLGYGRTGTKDKE
jgi:flagellar biosynthetic protein FlhB